MRWRWPWAYLVVFLKRPGGPAQFSAALALQEADDKFGALHHWINDHLGDELSLSVLAERRSFLRVLAVTPQDYRSRFPF